MVKHVWYLLGILTGFLLSELWRRQHLERMRYAEGILEEQRQSSIETIKELEALDAQRSTEERIKYAMWDALREEDNDETQE
jgi:beta-lactamase regulating signal transducer with metallopeptidase domain